MSSVGNWLRAARESRGLSLPDVEAATRIRTRYLEALETGNYAVMTGGEAQVRGFLRRYAGFLGLSPDEAIARYEQKGGSLQPEVTAVAPAPQPPPAPSAPRAAAPTPPVATAAPKAALSIQPPPARQTIPRSAIWRVAQIVGIVGFIALLAVAGVWLLTRPDQGSGTSATATATAGVVPLTPQVSPTPLIGATSAPPAPPSTPTFPAVSGGVTLTLEAGEHVWVRVTVDGAVAFTGMLAPAAPQTWSATQAVVVETGNGAGVVAVVNGQSLGPLCGRGEVCTRAWGPAGEITAP